jgi:hypothetical protein
MFCNLSLREIAASGPTTAAQARVRFINCGDDATSLQTISTGQSSQTSSDHDDPRAGCDSCCTEQRCRQGQSCGRRRNRANKLTTRHGGIMCGRITHVGLGCCRRGVAKEFSKSCVRHNEIGVLHRDCIVLREGLQRRVSHTLFCDLPIRSRIWKHVLQYRDRGARRNRCCKLCGRFTAL